jgi:hypothetical protein
MKPTAFSALCLLATTTARAYHWPSPQLDAIEGFLYEFEPEPPGHGSLHLTLNGCKPRNNDSAAAEWLRFVRRLLSSIITVLRCDSDVRIISEGLPRHGDA